MAVKRRRKRDTKRELAALFISIFHLFIAMFHAKTRLKPRVTRCTLEDENIKYRDLEEECSRLFRNCSGQNCDKAGRNLKRLSFIYLIFVDFYLIH